MEELNFEQMECTQGGKFWGRHDFNCHGTNRGTWCCYDYSVFWIDVAHKCDWAHNDVGID